MGYRLEREIMGAVIAVSLALGLLGSSEGASAQDGAKHVSFVALLSKPESFDHEVVRVEGYLHFRIGDQALYLSTDAARYGIIANALWLQTSPATTVASHRKGKLTLKDLDGRYVSVTGVFDCGVHGHLGAYPGGIRSVQVVQELSPTN